MLGKGDGGRQETERDGGREREEEKKGREGEERRGEGEFDRVREKRNEEVRRGGGFKTDLAAVNAVLHRPDLGTAWPHQFGTGRTCLS